MATNSIKTIAVLTGGGDCPGLNAVIRAVTKTAINKHGLKVWGIEDGFLGLIEDRMRELTYDDVSSILTVGGTILGASNKANPTAHEENGEKKDVTDRCIEHLRKRDIDAVVALGGDGTMAISNQFAERGLPIMGVPKTIDNDIMHTDVTFGFDTAVCTATEAIDKIQTTASSHHRAMVIEVMGRYAGWIALHAGVAGGGDVILIPELPYDLDVVCEYVKGRSRKGRRFSIIVVAEGAKPKGGEQVIKQQIADSPDPIRLGGISEVLVDQINKMTHIETRGVNLGHVLRGGTPTPFDRDLATALGYTAMEQLMAGRNKHIVVYKDGELTTVELSEVAGKTKTVPQEYPLIQAARAVGTCLGV